MAGTLTSISGGIKCPIKTIAYDYIIDWGNMHLLQITFLFPFLVVREHPHRKVVQIFGKV